jgi:multidrug efflux pump subunit AcrA (membrane-fusion protein)
VNVVAERGDDVRGGSVLFDAGVSTRTLNASIDLSDDRLIAVGDTVKVRYSDESEVDGTITSIGGAEPKPGATDGAKVTPFTVSVTEIPEKLASRSTLSVTVQIIKTLAKDAVVVPADALLAQGDGSYAVQVVSGSTTKLVKVEPGLFADGLVAVEGLKAGDAVTVPS